MIDVHAQRGPFTFMRDSYNEETRAGRYRTAYLAIGWLHVFVSRSLSGPAA